MNKTPSTANGQQNLIHDSKSRDSGPLSGNPPDTSPLAPAPVPQPPSRTWGALLFLALSTGWFAITWWISGEFATSHFWVVVVSVFLFSVPIALCGVYANTVRQIRRLYIFANRGWLFRWVSGRPIKVLLWICWALCSSFFMLVQFHTYRDMEWVAFFLVIPVFALVFLWLRTWISHEIKPFLVTGMALAWARRICPFLLLAAYVLLMVSWGDMPEYPSLSEAIHAKKAAVAHMTGSALVQEISQYQAFYEGVKAYALGRPGHGDAIWPLVLLGIGHWVVFYNACAILSCFLIPAVEYRRIFGPLTDADRPPPVPLSRMAAISALTAFLSLFIYLPFFAYLEMWVQQSPQMVKARQEAEVWAIPKLEQIGDAFFKEGTIVQLERAKLEALHSVEASLVHLEAQTDLAFARLEANVDAYLDWYYSLVGEYARIASLLVGQLEDYMMKKLEEYLQQGDAFQEVEAALNAALSEYERAQALYQEAARKILAENQVRTETDTFRVVQSISLKDVLDPPVHEDMIGLQTRLLAGGGTGAAAGVVTAMVIQKILAKVMGKNILKVAAKALSKVVLSKTAGSAGGAAAGAAAGAAIGSLFPGLGTATGAVIGGILGGLAAGVAVDKLLLELEQAMNREEFKQEILSAIHAAREEFKASLRG